MIDGFESITFREPAQARDLLGAMGVLDRPDLLSVISEAMKEVADPDTVIRNLARFMEGQESSDDELAHLASSPDYAQMLATVFDQSHFLTDILCRFPQYAEWLWTDGMLDRARARDEMVSAMASWAGDCDSPASCGLAMRRFRQREILRIGVRDIFKHVPLYSLTQDLSFLADAALETALGAVYPVLHERFGRPMFMSRTGQAREARLGILGMGKLGGLELNFSSDIDLVFIHTEDGETEGGTSSPITNEEFFQKLGEQVIKLVSEQTAEGSIFRVDMRLRPYGRLSPLSISLPRALDYYEGCAQAWERQALLKARPVAGDLVLGGRLIEEAQPFIFPRYFDDETLNSIRDIKQQMEAQIAARRETELDVKLGRGGIRDIEFTVQILQMLNGGRMPDLRTPKTLDAIKALGVRSHLKPLEATALSSNYVFLRQVEHRLQIEGNQQRHVLPDTREELDLLARRLGYSSSDAFMADYRDRADETRGILNRFLSTEGSGNLWTYDLLSPHSDGIDALNRLRQHGFRDPEKARQEFQRLSAGPEQQPYPLHVRQQFAAVAPTLVAALAASGDPDGTLIRLGRILNTLGAPGAIYETLKMNPNFSEYLVTLASNSQYLSEILIRDPGLFDVFGSGDALDVPVSRGDLDEQLAILLRAHDPDAAPYRLRDGEMLRVGLRELLRNVSVVEVGRELTQLAEVCLYWSLERARVDITKRYGPAEGCFAILGMGKLGGREMGYGSDLDLIFVYDSNARTESGMAASQYYAAVAAKTINRLKESTRYGTLYDIDSRLRPDGKKGVLSVSSRRLPEYYCEEAQAWERLALMKVRFVAGDTEFGQQMEQIARDVAFSLPLNAETLAHIDEIRKRIAQGAGPLDVKKGEGGIAELEFTVRLLQLRHAAEFPEMNRADVLGALELLKQKECITSWDYDVLHDAYVLFRRVENRIRMMNGRSASSIPEDPADQADLTRRLGLKSALEDLVKGHKKSVHAIYLTVLQELERHS